MRHTIGRGETLPPGGQRYIYRGSRHSENKQGFLFGLQENVNILLQCQKRCEFSQMRRNTVQKQIPTFNSFTEPVELQQRAGITLLPLGI